jgi:hypothetical protein
MDPGSNPDKSVESSGGVELPIPGSSSSTDYAENHLTHKEIEGDLTHTVRWSELAKSE